MYVCIRMDCTTHVTFSPFFFFFPLGNQASPVFSVVVRRQDVVHSSTLKRKGKERSVRIVEVKDCRQVLRCLQGQSVIIVIVVVFPLISFVRLFSSIAFTSSSLIASHPFWHLTCHQFWGKKNLHANTSIGARTVARCIFFFCFSGATFFFFSKQFSVFFFFVCVLFFPVFFFFFSRHTQRVK